MSDIITNSLMTVIGTGVIYSLYSAFSAGKCKKKGQTEPKVERRFLPTALPEDNPEKKLYLAVLDQLGESFHVQFGTSLDCIVRSTTSGDLLEGAIDILLVDPRDLTPKLAVFLTRGGRIWENSIKDEKLAAIEALGVAGISVLSLPRQDYYNCESLIAEMLDALGSEPTQRKDFFS